MAHSPLLRTAMRLKLDGRSISLVNYELTLEDASSSILPKPPSQKNFDEVRWTELRKTHENKKARETRQKEYEHDFMKALAGELRKRTQKKLLTAWKGVIPTKSSALRLAVAKSGFAEWRPPLLSECLLFEQSSSYPPICGRVHAAEMGILDRRLLHVAISPKYVPKPHFKMERKRLAAKSAEFAAFVAQQTSGANKRSLIPRPQDESSDEGLLTVNEAPIAGRAGSVSAAPKPSKIASILGKRKRAPAKQAAKGARKPPKFVKLYDCRVHDRAQLVAQGMNRCVLMQQRLPRVENPAPELVKRRIVGRKAESPEPMDVDGDPAADAARELQIHGIALPVRLLGGELSDEQECPSLEDAVRYRSWRTRARRFFNERDRYMQSRVYQERSSDRDLLRAVQALTSFWVKLKI
ncbi:hypothetical protein GGS23DRAFT_550951 [Durotheca rogersii]|uniref:uncharacterized protein n=1 Tax=Durotheca rogersii TaxID=419775 RepID=UPI0022210330|nr:uncharacterized protein GGS23DRAFT_550951 [Durotheca rogersii]KAI5866519.1 hypothetical protein GGS23DRAFT_550951 [Durotheca rogersii]